MCASTSTIFFFFFAQAGLELQSSNLCLPSNWYCSCVPPYLAILGFYTCHSPWDVL
jgi:hypothetical protein